MSYERFHWRLYNIMRRLVGLAAGITCLAFIWSAVSLWLHLRVPEPGESMATGYEYLIPAALTLARRSTRGPTHACEGSGGQRV